MGGGDLMKEKTDAYNDYNPNSFSTRLMRTVYKWWCVVYKPVYVLTHKGYWPEDKNPENKYPTEIPSSDIQSGHQDNIYQGSSEKQTSGSDTSGNSYGMDSTEAARLANQIIQKQTIDLSGIIAANQVNSGTATNNSYDMETANHILHEKDDAMAKLIAETKKNKPTDEAALVNQASEIDTSNIDAATLDRANEIIERLAREAAADEAKKQADIEEAMKQRDLAESNKAQEEKLAQIMSANKVDISAFIEEGKNIRTN